VTLQREELNLPGYLAELARLEWTIHQVDTAAPALISPNDDLILNPTLHILEVSWKNLSALANGKHGASQKKPEPGEDIVLVWQDPDTKRAKLTTASPEDLLVLKIIVEKLDPMAVTTQEQLPAGAIDGAIRRAVSRGLLLAPPSRIQRHEPAFPSAKNWNERFVSSPFFTLQWHITQACDLHCKHCYDRSERSPLKLEQGLRILDGLRNFCKDRRVQGQVSFTGGNPLLYPHFLELYQAAAEQGLVVAILGNPAPRKTMEKLLAIQKPVFFQVSLEGLQQHNDDIRGAGHFDRVVGFLALLQELEIPSKVMLTLTQGNMDQVLPLAESLRNLTDNFTFNRLSMVGEGANLQPPSKKAYEGFLRTYVEASRRNPIMGWKDNFINVLCHERGEEPFGGCTGYGCGAAFNFMAVLSDGEVHACRKFPSPLGNIFNKGFAEIYDSDIACRYRRGPQTCQSCAIHLVCRGCLAVAHSHGLNVFEERDPYCFMPTTKM
jgi:selenobiotic family peptide radical SAM maturase